MAEVKVTIGGRGYPIVCDDGQENRVAALAARIDAEARAFSKAGGSLSEARLLLMSALMIADKLDEAETRLAAAPPPEPAPPPQDLFSGMSAEDAASRVEAATRRIAELAARKPAATEAEPQRSEGKYDGEDNPEEPDDDMAPEDMRALRRERRRRRMLASEDD